MLAVDSAGAVSPVARCIRGCAALIIALGLLSLGQTAFAAANRPNQTVIIENDRGGSVVERENLIKQYLAAGTHVEIRGEYCLSSCTMYLSLPETCVEPHTTFGFHGPSSQLYGISLSPAQFDRWSQVMAAHYPEPLRTWYLQKGRNRTVGFHRFSGAQLIRMGLRRCS